jgi:hypothetical protein
MNQRINPRESGQAIIVIALLMVVLMAFLALAIDGGAAYSHRRTAQNASDAGALAGAVVVASGSEQATEADVLNQIRYAVASNGIDLTNPENTVNAWYIDNRGFRVSDDQIGTWGWIPDCEGAVGVEVEITMQFDTFVAQFVGQNQLAATTDSGAIITFSNFCRGWTIWADCPTCGNTTLQVSGSDKSIYGGVHSNDGLHVTGASLTLNPPAAEFGDSGCVDTGGSVCPPSGLAYQVYSSAMPQLYAWEDFVPGGYWWNDMCTGASADKCFYQDYLPANPLHNGLYVITNGDVDQSTTFAHEGMQVTFALLNGDVKLTSDEPLMQPFKGDSDQDGSKALFAIFNGDVTMNGNSHDWDGTIFVPHGQATITGSESRDNDGSVYAWLVHISGSESSITHSGYWCPPEEGNVILLW